MEQKFRDYVRLSCFVCLYWRKTGASIYCPERNRGASRFLTTLLTHSNCLIRWISARIEKLHSGFNRSPLCVIESIGKLAASRECDKEQRCWSWQCDHGRAGRATGGFRQQGGCAWRRREKIADGGCNEAKWNTLLIHIPCAISSSYDMEEFIALPIVFFGLSSLDIVHLFFRLWTCVVFTYLLRTPTRIRRLEHM
jgi:hypothetical protein